MKQLQTHVSTGLCAVFNQKSGMCWLGLVLSVSIHLFEQHTHSSCYINKKKVVKKRQIERRKQCAKEKRRANWQIRNQTSGNVKSGNADA